MDDRMTKMEHYTINDVILTEDQTGIEKIGDYNNSSQNITKNMLIAFLQKYKKNFPYSGWNKDHLIKIVIALVKGEDLRQYLKVRNSKSLNNLRSKPNCLTTDNSLYRMISILCTSEGKQSFIETRKNYNKNDLTSKQPH